MSKFGFQPPPPDGDIYNPREDERQFRIAEIVKGLGRVDTTRWSNSYQLVGVFQRRLEKGPFSHIESQWLEMRIGAGEAVRVDPAMLPHFCDECQQKFPLDELTSRHFARKFRHGPGTPETRQFCEKCEPKMDKLVFWLDRGEFAWENEKLVRLGV